MEPKILIEKLKAGTEKLVVEKELLKKLSKNKKLKVKFGMDPTAPDLHLGHAVVLSKLKLLQDAGHQICLIIGDFTARIGDPTGRSKTRPPLSESDIAKNAQTYLDQIGKILDTKNLEVAYNSSWLDKINSRDWITLCARITVAQIIERDDFKKRLQEGLPIHLHEILYPLMQAYDSVEIKADLELGGSDQTFNLLMGRTLQEQFDLEPQCILTMPLLEGLDGSAKMSKSYGNTIGLTETPQAAFGKLMSISDKLMWRYYQLLLNKTSDEIATMQRAVENQEIHPMELKKRLAFGVVERFWSSTEAIQGKEHFEQLFQKRDMSAAQDFVLPAKTPEEIDIIALLRLVNAAASNSDARRLITGGGVSINGTKITDQKALICTQKPFVLKAGKHKFFNVHT